MSNNFILTHRSYIRYVLRMQKILFLVAFLTFSAPAMAADAPEFQLPIDCMIGKDCWIMNYVDMDPDDGGFQDPLCGARGYDGHKGTDIAIRSQAEMEEGVAVLAPQDGKVEKVRDGEPDRFPTEEQIEQSKADRKECGNAVSIDHGNGLKTIYCHMKKGSIAVKPEQEIKAGDKIGEVGLSGMTEFPHIHFGILWEGAVMDPFTGQSSTQGCGVVRRSLWHPDDNLIYQDTAIYHAGFSTKVPKLDAIDRGDQPVETIKTDADILTFWFAAFGSQEGDAIDMKIIAPDGSVFARHTVEEPKTRTRIFYFMGKKLEDNPLIPGTYIGEVTISRKQDDGSIKTFLETRRLQVTAAD